MDERPGLDKKCPSAYVGCALIDAGNSFWIVSMHGLCWFGYDQASGSSLELPTYAYWTCAYPSPRLENEESTHHGHLLWTIIADFRQCEEGPRSGSA